MAVKSVHGDSCTSDCGEQQLCAVVSKTSHEDPIGSASGHDRYVLVEVPEPWEKTIFHSEYFPAGLADTLNQATKNGHKFRFLSFTSDFHPSPAGYRRIMSYTKPAAPFARYAKVDYVVPEAQLNALAEAIIEAPERLSQFAAYAQNTADVRDLFVCTHGSVDVCCGKFGYPIYKTLEEEYAAKLSGALRVWKISHIGGHRHAPTLVDLPEGRYWAQIESGDLDTLVHRQGSFADISRKYRGWGGAGGKFEQMVERELYIREGWDWIHYNKMSVVLNQEESSVRVRIDYRSADGAVSGAYEGTVVPAGTVIMGGCGGETKDFPQFKVINVVKVD